MYPIFCKYSKNIFLDHHCSRISQYLYISNWTLSTATMVDGVSGICKCFIRYPIHSWDGVQDVQSWFTGNFFSMLDSGDKTDYWNTAWIVACPF